MRFVGPSASTGIAFAIFCAASAGCFDDPPLRDAGASLQTLDADVSAADVGTDTPSSGDDAAEPGEGGAATPMVKEAGTPESGDVIVDPANAYQTIDGFGASDAFTPGGALSQGEVRLLFDPAEGIGLSLLRIGIDSNGQPLGSGTFADVQAVAPYGVTVWGAPWTPPAADKDNASLDNGGHLCSDAGQGACSGAAFDDWASTLAAFPDVIQQTTGVSLYAISAQNEPDFAASYVSCVYTGAQMVDFIKVLGPKLAARNPPVKLIAPEPESWAHLYVGTSDCSATNYYAPCIHADPTAESDVAIFATHDYGFAPMAAPSWMTKPIWETEVAGLQGSAQAGPSVDITNGLAVATWIYNAVVSGGASAWHYWWLVSGNNDNEGLIFLPGQGPGGVGDVTSPPKRLYVVGNFSRFVRPGYRRISVSGVPSGVLMAAFQNPTDETTAIVAINLTKSATPLSIFVAGTGWPATASPWVTSATANLAPDPALPVTGGRFTATLDPQSVTTFVGAP
jgi:glucuronoarabinoxylan endo-1,4-beta-xylanase